MLDIKHISKQIREIVHNNGDMLKEEYNRYLSPFMVSPILSWSEYDEDFDYVWETLIEHRPTPTYARLANYDMKVISNNYQVNLDEEYICICATIDNHMLKIGVMFEDSIWEALQAIGFSDNGDGTWDYDGRTITQDEAEKEYLRDYIKPSLKIARDNLMRIHQQFGGTFHDNQPGYWNNILGLTNFGEPEDNGDEYNEAYNPMLKEDVDEEDPEWMRNPIGSDEHERLDYKDLTCIIQCNYDEEYENDLYYNLSTYEKDTGKPLWEYGTNDWDELMDYIKDCYRKYKEYIKEPEDSGDEYNQLNETVSKDEKPDFDKYKNELIGMELIRTDNGSKHVITALPEKGLLDDTGYFHLHEKSTGNDYLVKPKELKPYFNFDVYKFIQREPGDTGDEYDEYNQLDETVEENSSWETNPPEEIGNSIKFKIGLSKYEAIFVNDNGFKKLYDLRILDPDNSNYYTAFTFDDWNDLVRFAKKYSVKPNAGEPDWDGDFDNYDEEQKINETVYDLSWRRHPPVEGIDKDTTYRGYHITFEKNDGKYYATMFEDKSKQYVTELSSPDWQELVNAVVDYADMTPINVTHNDNNAEPETDGSELDENVRNPKSKDALKQMYFQIIKKFKQISVDENYDNAENCENFIYYLQCFYDDVPGAGFDEIGEQVALMDKAVDLTRENTDLEYVREQDDDTYRNLDDFIERSSVPEMMYYLPQHARKWLAEEVYYKFIEYVVKHKDKLSGIIDDNDTEPETDGSELDETVLNENVSSAIQAYDLNDLMLTMSSHIPENINDRFVFKYKGYIIVVEKLEDLDQDPEDDREYYKAKLYDAEIEDETDAYITSFSYPNYQPLCYIVCDYIKNNPLSDILPDDTEPETDGSEFDELNETKDDSKWYEKPPEIGDLVRIDEGNYVIFIEHIYLDPDDDEDEEIDDDKREYFEIEIGKKLDEESVYIVDKKIGYKWENCVRYVKKYMDTFIKEPETDGSELDESAEDKSIDKEEYEYGYTEAQKWFEEGNRFDHYDNDEVSDDFWEGFCDGWDDAKNDINKFETTEPEDDGDELNESVQINENAEEYYVTKLYNILKDDDDIENIFNECNGDKYYFYSDVNKRCLVYVRDEKFHGKDRKTGAYIEAGDKYFNFTKILDDWKTYCENKYIDEPETDGDELDESWLPGAEWLDEPIAIGYSETYFYKGYDFAIEGVRDTDGDFYSLRIYIHDIADDDDALVQEASFDTWDELAFYVRDYVDEHPLKKEEETKEPEDNGDEYMESKLDIKNIKKQINEIVEEANG